MPVAGNSRLSTWARMGRPRPIGRSSRKRCATGDYRIYSPVILIEFDHLPGIIWDNTEPTRDHIHTVVRTPNGNDYGRDLLRQHYAQHDHSNPHSAHRRGLV
jgi:hypothetical protein